MGPTILQHERPGGARPSGGATRVCGSCRCEFNRGGLPRPLGLFRDVVRLLGYPSLSSTGRRDYGGPIPPVGGREVCYFRPREERLNCYSLLLEGPSVQPPPDSIPGGGNGAAGRHKKVRLDAKGAKRALSMSACRNLRLGIRGAKLGLLLHGSGIHCIVDVWGYVQIQ